MARSLGVADDGDDRDVADRNDQPGPVRQPFPGKDEGGGQEEEEKEEGDQDLEAGPMGERNDADEDGAERNQCEERQPHPGRARESRDFGPARLGLPAPRPDDGLLAGGWKRSRAHDRTAFTLPARDSGIRSPRTVSIGPSS